MLRYCLRDISREDAARASGLPLNTLDVWIHRHGPLGGKRKGARVFSLRDVVALACARKLERAGVPVPDALRICGEMLHDPPAADAVLVIEDGVPRLAHGDLQLAGSSADTMTCLWIGHIADHVTSKLEAASVAIH